MPSVRYLTAAPKSRFIIKAAPSAGFSAIAVVEQEATGRMATVRLARWRPSTRSG